MNNDGLPRNGAARPASVGDIIAASFGETSGERICTSLRVGKKEWICERKVRKKNESARRTCVGTKKRNGFVRRQFVEIVKKSRGGAAAQNPAAQNPSFFVYNLSFLAYIPSCFEQNSSF